MSRARAVAPWFVVAAAITAVICLAAWPRPTGYAAGLITAAAVLATGLRLLAAEQRQTDQAPCLGCAGCGGPDCAEHPDGSGPDPETTPTHPDEPAKPTADQAGHDPDDLRTRLATVLTPPAASTRSTAMPSTDSFQDRGDAARRAAGIDGTAGDAQDIRHHYVEDPAGGCLLCGLAPAHRQHIDRPLDCGFCFEEDGEEVHPHPECPRGGPAALVMTSAPLPPTPRCPECQHPMGDHSVHTPPRPTWCHACNTTCAYRAAAPTEEA